MEKRNIVNHLGQIIGELELPDWTPEEGWASRLSLYSQNQSKPLDQIVYSKIEDYERRAPKLLREIKVSNTLAGITTSQSAEVFENFKDVILAIREGAFPTALYLLNAKSPLGYVTQDMLDEWKKRVISYL